MVDLDKLKFIAIKGSGFFCNVKKYVDETSGNSYALKELKKEHYSNSDYRYRLMREIQLLNDLKDCDSIIDQLVSGNDKVSEQLWYLMPYADFNLYDYIKKHNNSFTINDRFDIIDQVIAAIKYAHNLKILHRDISPNNVLVFIVNSKPVIKVSDFGLGKNSESLSYLTHSSASGYGQNIYVSPEQRYSLKDATVRSDIYSLGKLVYFVFTGRDPIDIKQFELMSLVTKATEEYPDHRHSNIDDFIAHYNGLKELQLNQTIPLQYVTLKEIIKERGNIDYNTFHEITIKAVYRDHVYFDYLLPVTEFLLKDNRFTDYYNVVGSNIRYFAKTYSEKLDECLKTTGWPFNYMDTFGKLLTIIVKIVSDDETRLICLKQLWYLAFTADQWDVQKGIKTVLNETYISSSIATELSEYIIESGTYVELEHFDGINLPNIIKYAVIKCNEIVLKKK